MPMLVNEKKFSHLLPQPLAKAIPPYIKIRKQSRKQVNAQCPPIPEHMQGYIKQRKYDFL
jgi:hypothetical protein